MSSVYGVKIPGTDGRAGMASNIAKSNLENFDFKGLTEHLKENLPSYAIPIIIRFKSEFSTTATHKIKKAPLKNEGFDVEVINDPLYIKIPSETNYIPLKKEIYNDIQNEKILF